MCKSCEKGLWNKSVREKSVHTNESFSENSVDESPNKEKDDKYVNVVVKDIKMNFASMVEFMVKLAFASIPAIIIICIIGFIINVVLISFLAQLK